MGVSFWLGVFLALETKTKNFANATLQRCNYSFILAFVSIENEKKNKQISSSHIVQCAINHCQKRKEKVFDAISKQPIELDTRPPFYRRHRLLNHINNQN